MDAAILTQKQLQERIDLENLQKSEIDRMDARHKLEALEAKGKYFETKRQEQRQTLLDQHKKELDELFVIHEKEYEKFQQVKRIINEPKQLSFDLPPKRDVSFRNKEMEEKQTLFQRIKKRIQQKLKGRRHEPEM
jgi:hypothetical protein